MFRNVIAPWSNRTLSGLILVSAAITACCTEELHPTYSLSVQVTKLYHMHCLYYVWMYECVAKQPQRDANFANDICAYFMLALLYNENKQI